MQRLRRRPQSRSPRHLTSPGPPPTRSTAPGVATAITDGPLGPLLLAATPHGLTRVAFEGHGDFDALRAHATSRRGSQAARRHLIDAAAKLRDYFAGNTDRVDWVVDWAFLESAGAAALRSTESIPYAGHRSYTDLSNAGSARDLGWIMGANPIPIVAPCHRVTRGVEVPTTFVGGAEPPPLARKLTRPPRETNHPNSGGSGRSRSGQCNDRPSRPSSMPAGTALCMYAGRISV